MWSYDPERLSAHSPIPPMTWRAELSLDYALSTGRTVARHRHQGPLRVLQSLYPEGDAVCHNVLAHPPGGIVGGDVLDIRVAVGEGAHGLLTTPGATRFYRSEGAPGVQQTVHDEAPGARLEWLPREALYYAGCLAENRLTMRVAPGGELIGWDCAALGLPHAGQPFDRGRVLQHLDVPGAWLERGAIDARDERLLRSPLGMAGQGCWASVFFVAGSPLDRARRDAALEAARCALAGHVLAATAGATSPHPRVLVARVLAPVVEPAMDALRRVRAAWRRCLWSLPETAPRIWAM